MLLMYIEKFKNIPMSIMWARFRAFALGHIYGRLYLDCNKDITKTVIIVSTQRSGSTWLSELLNYKLHYRFIHEPIRKTENKTLRKYARKYIRPDQKDEYLKSIFESWLLCKRRSYHLNRKNYNFICYGRLIKDVGSNLLLKWLHVNFPSVPIIYIIRNPLLVVSSCKNVSWLSPVNPQFWRDQKDLWDDYLIPFQDLIDSSKSETEKYILEWCIQNYVPKKQFKDYEWKVVFYDDLVRNPEITLKGIFKYLKVEFDKKILKKTQLPSLTSEDIVKSKDKMLNKWEDILSTEEIATIIKYVQIFGLTKYLNNSE